MMDAAMVRRALGKVDSAAAAAPQPSQARRRRDTSAIASVWQSALTGAGTTSKDRITGFVPVSLTLLNVYQLAVLYYGDDLINRIVDMVVNDSLADGYCVRYKGESDADAGLVEDVKKAAEEIGLLNSASSAASLGRAFGGAGIWVVTNKGRDVPIDPIDPERVTSVDHLQVLDRRELSVVEYETDVLEREPRAHFPEHRYYMPGSFDTVGPVGTRIHASRVLGFGAKKTASYDRRQWFGGWDCPVIEGVWPSVRSFRAVHQSADAMLEDSSQKVLKLLELAEVTTQDGGAELLTERLNEIALTRSMHGFLPLSVGADYEEGMEVASRTFAGIGELLRDKQAIVSSSADVPITKLFGRSPAGENATGESDADIWNWKVAAYQTHHLTIPMTAVVRLIARTLGASDPEGFYVSFPLVERLNLKEFAELYKLEAEADDIRIAQGLPAETVLLHRHGGDEYNHEPPLLTSDDRDALEATRRMEQSPPPVEEDEPVEPEEEPGDEGNKGAAS